MSNVNFAVSLAIRAARGDKAACAAGIADAIYAAYRSVALHNQKTPFINGAEEQRQWKGVLSDAIGAVMLTYWKEAGEVFAAKVKPTSGELEVAESRIAASVMEAYQAEAARKETAKAASAEKRESKKRADAEESRLASLASLDNTVQAGDLKAANDRAKLFAGQNDAYEARIAALEEGIRIALKAATKSAMIAALERLAVAA